LKQIAGGRLKGKTDINPQWRYEAMTEAFGPCGVGWKYEIARVWNEPGEAKQVFAFAEVKLYYKDGDTWSEAVPGIGGHMLIVHEQSGLHCNDEAYKMAITDALSVAMKALGVAADIYAGRWDGSKYATQEGSQQPTQPPQTPGTTPGKQGSPKGTRKAPPKTGQQGASQGRSLPYAVNDEEQKRRQCINSTLVAELRQAVLKQDKANVLDATSDFLPWVEEYLDGLYQTLQKQGAKVQRKHKGTAQVLLDIPASAYKEILERVEKEPKTCRAGYAQAAEQEAEQYGDDGVA
jgi:hypothetical protein